MQEGISKKGLFHRSSLRALAVLYRNGQRFFKAGERNHRRNEYFFITHPQMRPSEVDPADLNSPSSNPSGRGGGSLF